MSLATLPPTESHSTTAVAFKQGGRPILALRGVAKGYGTGIGRTDVLRDINLEIHRGELLAICGFSGSGKTTLMQLLAGLIRPDRGEILMEGRRVEGPSSDRGLVFQNYSLLPWLTVHGNIALAVNSVFRSWSRARRRQHVEHFIRMVGLGHAASRRPHELSGGMRQRVALARTLATKPRVLLLDEPLSALDALTRGVLQQEILQIWEEERQTCVLVTNDVDEAILLADRIVPLTPGPAATLGPCFPVELDRPRDKQALNRNPRFKALRNEVTKYLLEVRSQARQQEAGTSVEASIVLPRTEPIDFRKKPYFVPKGSHGRIR